MYSAAAGTNGECLADMMTMEKGDGLYNDRQVEDSLGGLPTELGGHNMLHDPTMDFSFASVASSFKPETASKREGVRFAEWDQRSTRDSPVPARGIERDLIPEESVEEEEELTGQGNDEDDDLDKDASPENTTPAGKLSNPAQTSNATQYVNRIKQTKPHLNDPDVLRYRKTLLENSGRDPGEMSLKEQVHALKQTKNQNFDLKCQLFFYERQLKSAVKLSQMSALDQERLMDALQKFPLISDLESSLRKAESQMKHMVDKSDYEKAQNEMAQLRDEVQIQRNQIQELTDQNGKAAARMANMQSTIDKHSGGWEKESNATLHRENIALRSRLADFNAAESIDFETQSVFTDSGLDSQTKIGKLRDQLAELRMENQKLTDFKETADQVESDLEVDKLVLAEELEQRVGIQKELEEENENLRRALFEMEEERAQQPPSLQGNDRIERAYDTTVEALNTSNKRIASLERQVIQLENSERTLLYDLEVSNTGHDRANSKYEAATREVQFLRDEYDNNADQNADFEDVSRQNETYMLELKQELEEAGHTIAEMSRQVELYKAMAERIDSVDDDEREHEQQNYGTANISAENSKLKQEIWTLVRKSSGMQMEVQQLQRENSDARRAIGALLNLPPSDPLSLRKSVRQLVEGRERSELELAELKKDLQDKDRHLSERDGLLETMAEETKKLSQRLEREKAAARDSAAQLLKQDSQMGSHTRQIQDLEKARQREQRELSQVQSQIKDQLSERNNLLATTWQRISAIVGSRFAEKLTGGVIMPSANFPQFSSNLLQCIKTLEITMSKFKERCESVERELWKDYQ